MKTQKTLLASAISIALVSATTQAQEASSNDTEAETEVIEVRGIKGSLVNARNIKLQSDGIVDAYFAEDIGKSSDEDITSALQRLPGVTIERGGEGGDQGTVVVRGIEPGLNLIKFNGVTLTSNNSDQSVDLSSFSADVLSSIIVSKGVQAKEDEGSLGGTVYLESAGPIGQDDTLVLSLDSRYNDLTEEITPRFTTAFSKELSEKFGIAGTVFIDQNEQRVDNYETFLGGWIEPRNNVVDQNGNALPDGTPALAEGFANYRTFDRDIEKFGGTLTLQFVPTEDTDVRLDIAYSEQSLDFTMFENRTIQSSFAPADQAVGQVIDTRTGRLIESYRTDGALGLTQTRQQEGDTDNLVVGLDVEHIVGDWTLHGKLAYSKTEVSEDFLTFNIGGNGIATNAANAVPGPNGGLCGFQTQAGDGPLRLPVQFDCPAFDRNDPSTLGLNGGSSARSVGDDEFKAVYFDVSRQIHDNIITSIDAGFKVSTREKSFLAPAEAFYGLAGLAAQGVIDGDLLIDVNGDGEPDVLPLNDPNLLQRTPGGWLAGIAPQALPSILAADLNAVRDLLFPNGFPEAVRSSNEPLFVEEDAYAAYLQVNFGSDDERITGNFGLRYVGTDVSSRDVGTFQFRDTFVQPNGQLYPESFALDSFEDSFEYNELLPSFNLKVEITDELIARASIGRSLARPNLDALQPGFNVIARDPGFPPTGSGGNTRLNPFVSDNYDLSIEWYFNDEGYVSAGIFNKEIDSFIFNNTINRNFENPVTGEECLVNRTAAPEAERLTATVAEFGCSDVLFSTQVNGASADIFGVELSYSQVYDFLPGLWQYLGATVNYTFADSEAQTVSDISSPLNGLPFPNTSENSLNSTLFWDNGDLSFRFAYTYRDEALIQVNNNNQAIVRDARGVLDFSANYNVTDNLIIFFAANNITDTYDYLYQATIVSSDPSVPVQVNGTSLSSIPNDEPFRVNHTGRSYRLGLRYTF